MLRCTAEHICKNDYAVISMDFQAQMSAATFEQMNGLLSKAFIDAFIETAMFSDETHIEWKISSSK